jgi:pimeloyl-ACP methyl ester carboxylesterase
MEEKVTFYSEGIEVAGVLGYPDDFEPGEQRGAVAFCHGFSIIKEIWFPAYAEAFRAAGYITLTFDYRHFGESGGEPRGRLVPMAQVADARSAVTFLDEHDDVDSGRIGLYGTSFGCGIATAAAGLDERVACVVGTAGPADCMRQFRHGDGFDAFVEKIRCKKAEFVTTGEVDYLSVPRMMRRDPEMEADLEALAEEHPEWRPEITFESMLDILDFKPESFAQLISPRAAMWIYVRDDLLVPLSEGQSYYAKAREPKRLVVLEGIKHREVYAGEGLERLLEHAIGWFGEHMPAKG